MEISVIIPVYNKKDYVEDCLSAALSLDFADYEVIVVDDGSTDGSGELCEEMAKEHARLRVFHQQNGGVTAARRYGWQQAQGRYVMFSDADDRLLPNALRDTYEVIQRENADMVLGSYVNQYGRVTCSGYHGIVEPSVIIHDILANRQHFGVLWAILFRKSLLDGCLDIPREIIEGEDKLMQVKCQMKHPKSFFIDSCIYYYRMDVPNDRKRPLSTAILYDELLRETLQPEWERYQNGMTLYQIKMYEFYLERKEFHVFREYYGQLRSRLNHEIPVKDRLIMRLPPRIAYCLVVGYHWLIRRKEACEANNG